MDSKQIKTEENQMQLRVLNNLNPEIKTFDQGATCSFCTVYENQGGQMINLEY